MDKISIAKRQFRMEEWCKRIAECQASGTPVTHWCRQNVYCEQTYYKYLKKFREEIVDALLRDRKRSLNSYLITLKQSSYLYRYVSGYRE